MLLINLEHLHIAQKITLLTILDYVEIILQERTCLSL